MHKDKVAVEVEGLVQEVGREIRLRTVIEYKIQQHMMEMSRFETVIAISYKMVLAITALTSETVMASLIKIACKHKTAIVFKTALVTVYQTRTVTETETDYATRVYTSEMNQSKTKISFVIDCVISLKTPTKTETVTAFAPTIHLVYRK